MTWEILVEKYFELLTYCEDKSKFDKDVFRMNHDNIASRFKKMSVEDQGEYTHIISMKMKDIGYDNCSTNTHYIHGN